VVRPCSQSVTKSGVSRQLSVASTEVAARDWYTCVHTIHRHVQGAFRTTNSELTVVHVLGRITTVVGRPCAPMLSLGADATTVLLAAPAMSFKLAMGLTLALLLGSFVNSETRHSEDLQPNLGHALGSVNKRVKPFFLFSPPWCERVCERFDFGFVSVCLLYMGAYSDASTELSIGSSPVPSEEEPSEQQEQTPPYDLHRTVYFVRHAESTWNAGNRRRNLFMLMRHVDHPLSTVGVGQAQALSAALQCSLKSADATGSQSMMDAALAPLGSAAEVWVSPATRCMQTVLLGLRPLLLRRSEQCAKAVGGAAAFDKPMPLRVRPFLREVKGAGWDNIGGARGAPIVERALRTLPSPARRDATLASESSLTRTEEASGRWWSPAWKVSEGRKSSGRRVQAMLHELDAQPSGVVVLVVSHSNFLRAALATHLVDPNMDDDMDECMRTLTQRLRVQKLPNCAVLGCELMRTPTSPQPIALAMALAQPMSSQPMSSQPMSSQPLSSQPMSSQPFALAQPRLIWPAEWPEKPRDRLRRERAARAVERAASPQAKREQAKTQQEQQQSERPHAGFGRLFGRRRVAKVAPS
jgi:broad specificity phosphatase PhoE